jgi:hypothetical protein
MRAVARAVRRGSVPRTPWRRRTSFGAYTRCTILPLLVVALLQSLACDTPDTESGRTMFVDTSTRARAPDGLTPLTAFPTIQEACNVAQPGDTIVVAPGLYFEHVVLRRIGTPRRPIKIQADEGESGVIVTGANRAIREARVSWELVDEPLGLYVVRHDTLRERPSRVLYSGTDLQPYPTVEELRRFTFANPADYPGPAHGFAWDESGRTLYVRLHASGKYGPADPNLHVMAVSPRNGDGGDGGAGLKITATEHFNFGVMNPGTEPVPSHVILDGFTFETPGVAGVFVDSAGTVTVRNCRCVGCRTLVSGRRFFNREPDYSQTTNDVRVENCDYSQFPAFDDMIEVIERGPPRLETQPEKKRWREFYWWHRKGARENVLLGYANTYETGIASSVGRNWVFHRNHIHDTFEGFSTWSLSTSRNTVIRGNRFERIVDNAIETENHASRVRIRGNLFLDVVEPVSWQPLAGKPWPGPITIRRNRVSTTARFQSVWNAVAQGSPHAWAPSVFKIGVASSNWDVRGCGGPDAAPEKVVRSPGRGFRAIRNTIQAPRHRLLGAIGSAYRYDSFRFCRNLVAADFSREDERALRELGFIFANNRSLPANALTGDQ